MMQNPRIERGPGTFGDDIDNRTDATAAPRSPTHLAARQVYEITLRAPTDDDAIRLVRAALKTLLRRFGLRCVRIKQIAGDEVQP